MYVSVCVSVCVCVCVTCLFLLLLEIYVIFIDLSVVKTPPSSAGAVAWTSGQGTKVPHATGCGQKLKKQTAPSWTSPSPVFAYCPPSCLPQLV